jgi:two-component system, chemotaxis family, protein-glutamate methylesterase/glutaminase
MPAQKPSALPKLLGRSGPLPALYAINNTLIEQGQVYVAPPDNQMLRWSESRGFM